MANIEGLKVSGNAMKDAGCALPPFDHLVRVNRVNNQAIFLEGFSHIFNNQINSIMLGGEYLKNFVCEIERCLDDLEREPEHLPRFTSELRGNFLSFVPKVIHNIGSSARRLNLIVSQLAEFSAAGTPAGSFGIDLNQVISLCTSMIEQQIHSFTDHFRLELASDIPRCTGDPHQILQVIFNLLLNSLRSLPGRSCEVVLSTSFNRESGQVRFCIRDDGTGIAPNVLPHIIEPFFTTWSRHGCLGLGLTVADRFVRCHNGELTIDSVPGKGTSALVSLPVVERPAACATEIGHD